MTVVESVYSTVQTGSLYKVDYVSSLKGYRLRFTSLIRWKKSYNTLKQGS